MLKKKFGEILVEQGVISQEQLEAALQKQKQEGGLLGQILFKDGFISKQQIAQALAAQVGIPAVQKITEQMINPDVLGKIPLKFLRQHIVIPIMFEGEKTILTANPRDLQPIDDLSLLLGGDVNCAVATDSEITAAINKYYPLETSKEMMEELHRSSN